MKILQINKYFYKYGGIEALYFNTINLLKEHGNYVIPFSSKDKNSYPSEHDEFFVKQEKEKRKPFNKILHYWRSFYSKEAANNLKQLLKIYKPDIAHIHNINGGITFSILPVLKEFNIPIVATIHGFKYLCPVWEFYDRNGNICEKCKGGKYYYCLLNNCSPRGIMRSFLLTMDSYLRDYFYPHYKYFDAYIFVSQFTMMKYLQAIPQIAYKSFLLYNFIHCNKFVFDMPHEKYFLFFGRLEKGKGLKILLEAFKQLPSLNLIIIGNGSMEGFILSHNLSNVKLLGYKSDDELKEIIGDSFFVIVPSESYENNPMAILEAYSHGKPVIASDIGGIPEIVEDGMTGFLFQRKNAEQLRDIIYKCAHMDNDTYLKMSNSAYQLAKKKFSPENYYQKLISIYNEVLERKVHNECNN